MLKSISAILSSSGVRSEKFMLLSFRQSVNVGLKVVARQHQNFSVLGVRHQNAPARRSDWLERRYGTVPPVFSPRIFQHPRSSGIVHCRDWEAGFAWRFRLGVKQLLSDDLHGSDNDQCRTDDRLLRQYHFLM